MSLQIKTETFRYLEVKSRHCIVQQLGVVNSDPSVPSGASGKVRKQLLRKWCVPYSDRDLWEIGTVDSKPKSGGR